MFNKTITIKSVYAHNHPKGMGVWFEPYGQLISYEFYYDNRRIFRAKGKGSKFLRYSILLEAIQDRVANEKQEIRQEGGYTIITETSNNINIIPEYKFILSYLYHTYDLKGGEEIQLNPHRAVNNKNFSYLDVRQIRYILSELASMGVEIIIFKDSEGYSFQDYQKHVWTKKSRGGDIE